MKKCLVKAKTLDYLLVEEQEDKVRWRDPSFSQAQRGQLHRVKRHCEVCGIPLPAHNGGKTNRCYKHRDGRHGQARLEVVKIPDGYAYDGHGQLVPDWWVDNNIIYRGNGLTGGEIEILMFSTNLPSIRKNPKKV